MWGVNSTVTKHSDYFVCKDTSERVTRRCDDTVDKKQVNSCVLEHLFWRGKYKIWALRPSIKGTNPLFIVIKAIIIIYQNISFGGSSTTKKIAPKPRLSPTRYWCLVLKISRLTPQYFLKCATNVTFSNFRSWRRKQENRAPRNFDYWIDSN